MQLGSVGYKINCRYFFAYSRHRSVGWHFLYSDRDKYNKVIQLILTDTAKKLESVLVQTVNVSKPRYHPLFEKFQNVILLLDAETGVITDVNNPNGLLTFSKLNEIPEDDLAIPFAVQQMASVDRLFLFNSDTSPAEKQEEINLPGIDQLPSVTHDRLQRILSCENVTNPIDAQAELHVQDLKFTYTEKR